MAEAARQLQRSAMLSCPECGHCKTEQIPVDACQFFYDYGACGARLKPKPGDCCVYCSYCSYACSYADVPGPPIQAEASCTSHGLQVDEWVWIGASFPTPRSACW